MGHRTIKRVPLDFAAPLNETWQGYLNPYRHLRSECSACKGSGYSPIAKLLHDVWYGNAPFDPASTGSRPWTPDDPPVHEFAQRNVERDPTFYRGYLGTANQDELIRREALRLCDHWNRSWSHHLSQQDVDALVDAGRLHDFTHTWSQEAGWQPLDPPPVVTAAQVNAWSFTGFGHDSINQWICVKARCQRDGVATDCPACKGSGDAWPGDLGQEAKAAYEAWEPEEPPTGDCWQLWETCSEGSPQSPVFATPQELARWCAMIVDDEPNATIFASEGMTYDQWLALIIEDGGMDTGSLMIVDGSTGYIGAVANMPQEKAGETA